MAKETYLYSKRDLLVWQKRPTCIAIQTLRAAWDLLPTAAAPGVWVSVSVSVSVCVCVCVRACVCGVGVGVCVCVCV